MFCDHQPTWLKSAACAQKKHQLNNPTALNKFLKKLSVGFGSMAAVPGLVLLLLISYPVLAQNFISVTGQVRSAGGQVLEGATVGVVGSSQTTMTDKDGNYSIRAQSADRLVFSNVGFTEQEVSIAGRSVIDIELVPVNNELNEVVVIGYQSQKRGKVTGSITTVKKQVFQSSPIGNISQTLQGSAPGVNVTTNSMPGTDAQIRIRGLGTINNNNPLWVIDGVPRTSGFNEINPADVQSITVLKDAASTAIYGARGANGVILVTTIQGKKSQAPKVDFSARAGFAKATSSYKLLNVEEHAELIWLQSKNAGVTPNHPYYGNGATPKFPKYLLPAGADQVDLSLYDIKSFPITEANLAGTDWFDEIMQPGVTHEYNISVTGGSENTVYAFSAGYLNEEGIVKLTGFERYSLTANVNTTVKKWLKIGENLRISQISDKGLQSDGETGALGVIPQLSPLLPVYDIRGNFAPVSRLTGFDPRTNPIGDLERGKDFRSDRLAISGNVHAIIDFMPSLTFKSLLGITIAQNNGKSPLEANPDSYQARGQHELTESFGQSKLWNFTNTLTYTKDFKNDHSLQVLLGTEAINNVDNGFSATRTKFFLSDENYWVLDAGEGVQTNSGNASDWSTFSYFGNVHYDIHGRYLFDAVFRRDGSSRFGSLNRYGNFPAVSVGWVASDENFLSGAQNFLNYLKLRASWGLSGNDQVGNYNGFTTYRTNHAFSSYPITGSNSLLTPGFESLAFGNPNAKWETTTTINFGVDATVFDRLDLTLDIWQRKTSDMLYPKGIPAVNGQATIPSVNIGDMKNNGIDLQINYRSKSTSDLRYNISLNFSRYKNEIVKLSDKEDETIIGADYRGNVYTRSEKGTSFPQFFGFVVDGIFQDQAEVDKHATYGSYNAPGRFKYRDVDGNGIINNSDRTYIGNPHPDFTSGLFGSVQYKQFDLSATFFASVGNDIVNVVRRAMDFNMFQQNRSKRRLYESWGSPYLSDNKDAKMPKAEITDATSMLPSEYFVEDGSFLRLQNLQLGYNLPKTFLQKHSIANVRIYLMATNLFTITRYTGLDPQIQTSDRNFGIDEGIWPTPKRFLIGLNLGL